MAGIGPTQSVATRGMRIATPCATRAQFVEAFHRYCEDNSFFVSTLTMREVGLQSAFSVDLTDGRPMLRGYGVVLDAWPTAANRFGRPGVHIGIHKLMADSQAVFDELQIARAIALEKKQAQKAARTMTQTLWVIAPAPKPASNDPASPKPLPGLTRAATQPRTSHATPPVAVPKVIVPKLARASTPAVVKRDELPATASVVDEAPTAMPEPAPAPPPADDDPSTFEHEAPTATAEPSNEHVTFETSTRTASPMYELALANERAARKSYEGPVAIPLEPAVAAVASEPPVRDSEPALALPPPPAVTPRVLEQSPPSSPPADAPPLVVPEPSHAAVMPQPRPWWMNVRVASVFAGGLVIGLLVGVLTRPSAPVTASPPSAIPKVPLAPPAAPPAVPVPNPPPPRAVSDTPPAKPAATKPATPPRAAIKPARPIAKPVRPIAKPAIAKQPVRPKPASKPKCVGLGCL